MTLTQTSILSACLVVTLTGCGVTAPETNVPPQTFDRADMSASGGDMGDVALGEGEGAGTMDGTWLLVHENSSCILGKEQVSISDYLVTIEQDGQLLRESRRICALDLSPVLGLGITIPDRVLETITFAQTDPGLITSVREGGGYTSQTEVALWGLDLEDPWRDPLPTDPDDPAVLDADEDGNVGVTFIVGDNTCERWAIQRQFINYKGAVVAPNRIEGTSDNITQTRVLDGSSSICRASPDLLPNTAFNNFVMVRVDGRGGAFDADSDGDGAITCEEVRGLGTMLNPGRDPMDANCR